MHLRPTSKLGYLSFKFQRYHLCSGGIQTICKRFDGKFKALTEFPSSLKAAICRRVAFVNSAVLTLERIRTWPTYCR